MNKQNHAGFTLIELLVVVGIIASLGSVVALNVSRFVASSNVDANSQEKQNLQGAIDLMINDVGLTPADTADITVPTDDWVTTNFYHSPAAPIFLYPSYLRQNPTKCLYTVDVYGRILTQTCPQ